MEQDESFRFDFLNIDKSNINNFLKTGLALAGIMLWSVLTVENVADNRVNPPAQLPMPAPPAYIKD